MADKQRKTILWTVKQNYELSEHEETILRKRQTIYGGQQTKLVDILKVKTEVKAWN